MKIKLLLLFTMILTAQAMEGPKKAKRRVKRAGQVRESAEPSKVAKKEYPRASLLGVPEEIRKQIFEYLYTAKGATSQIRLVNAAQNIRNFFMTSKEFHNDLNNVELSGLIIKELSDRYTGGNPIPAALALATDAASRWMARNYSTENMKIFIRAELRTAAVNNDVSSINFILKYASNQQSADFLNYASYDEPTPLIAAVQNRRIKVVNRLLKVPGIDVNVRGPKGMTALMIAAQNGETPIVERLLTAPNIDVNYEWMGSSALILAARYGHIAIVELLLAKPGINVNAKPFTGVTALMAAVENGHVSIVKRLLAVPGINVNDTIGHGRSALWFAGEYLQGPNKEAIIKMLIQHGATE